MSFLRTASIVLLLSMTAYAQPTPTAIDAWASISGTDAIVFATINNPSMYDVFIVSGKSESAASVEMIQGEKAVTSLTVPSFGSLQLAPGQLSIRVRGLKNQPKEGDELKLTLETDGGVGIPIAAIVKAAKP